MVRNTKDAKVLVYCMSGFSRYVDGLAGTCYTCRVDSFCSYRSPTIVIAYLMKLRGWRLAESYKWVKDRRASIKITQGRNSWNEMDACMPSSFSRFARSVMLSHNDLEW
jgi:hypothetical protein